MWAPLDIISFSTSEMSKRYGLIYVDQDDAGHGALKRYKKIRFSGIKQLLKVMVKRYQKFKHQNIPINF